ncbi:hypothetical protein B0H12DRAFT_1250312 [Mycena haematopus]|nr:hypothetical protein B0H12DRAFT_1250312 [Mycena haematopus]
MYFRKVRLLYNVTSSVFHYPIALAPVATLCTLLAAWLNLHVGMSRENSGIFLKAVRFIIFTTIELIFGVLRSAGTKIASPTLAIPQDIRTVYHDGLEPEIIRTPCCPTCYKPYSLDDMPDICNWRKSPRSWACGTPLWKQVHLRNGTDKKVPECLYATQSFESWLRFFLSRSQVEDQLEKTFQQDQTRQNMPPLERMTDVQDSPAWRSLGNFVLSRYHLVFGFYIDWFNPLTNKLAGPVVSCGAIVLYCLSLPIEVRFLVENICVLALIPGPDMPDVWTIAHIMISFARMINEFAPPGKVLPTFKNPLGVLVAARLVPLIADLQAIRKVAGYMAFNATQFCNWCLLKHADLEDLNYKSWKLRDSRTVAAQAKAWRDAITKTVKEALAKLSGVRSTPMHDIYKWDPVMHIVLGFMHNWLEGILMRHLRILWGIGRPKKGEKDVKNLGPLDNVEEELQSDMSGSGSEFEGLAQEKETTHQAEPQTQLPFFSTDMDVDGDDNDGAKTPTQETYLGDFVGDKDDKKDDDFLDFDIPGMFNFSSGELGQIRSCIKRISLPSWVARPPKNLGESKHGKLKASEYLTLFTVIFPLIIPELWWGKGNLELALLQNFHDLVACTNIISSFSTCNADADKFTHHYAKYREALPQLFPVKFHSVPNHHFAMHNGSLLKFWGPMPALSEFAGERMNGMLQQVDTNMHIDEMPLTMLRQMARRSRLEAKLTHILQPTTWSTMKASQLLTELEVTKILSTAPDLERDDYDMLLEYQNSTGQFWASCYEMRQPPGALILPPCALKPTEFKLGDQSFSRYQSTRNNSGIQFKEPTTHTVYTGFIDDIWQIPLEGRMQTFLMVQKHKLLPDGLLQKTPYPHLPLFQTTAVDAAQSNRFLIIEPRHILTHLSVFKRPKGTYGINRDILIICWASNRGRRS